MKINTHNFPLFLGEVKAEAYRWFGLTIRFKEAPTAVQQEKFKTLLPKYFNADALTFMGKMLMLQVGKIASDVLKDYDKCIEEDEDNRDEIAAEYTMYLNDFLTDRGFEYPDYNYAELNKALTKWLEEMHAVCPIQFVFRDETNYYSPPWDAYTTGDFNHLPKEVRQWSSKSEKNLPQIIKALLEDENLYNQTSEEKKVFSYVIKALEYAFDFGLENYDELADFVKHSSILLRLIKNNEEKELLTSIEENIAKNITDVVLFEDLSSILKHHFKNTENEVGLHYKKRIKLLLQLAKKLINNKNTAEICFRNTQSLALLTKVAALEHDAALLHHIHQFVTTFYFKGSTYINALGEQATSILFSKKYKEAIEMYKIVLDIIPKYDFDYDKVDLSIYCNALYALQNDNSGLPVNKVLNYNFLEKCLPLAVKNPPIYYNALCLHVEMNEFDKAYDYFLLIQKHDEETTKLMMEELKTETIFKDFKKYLEEEKKVAL